MVEGAEAADTAHIGDEQARVRRGGWAGLAGGQFVAVAMPLALLFASLSTGALATRLLPRWQLAMCALAVPLNVALAACTAHDGALALPGPIGMGSIGLFTLTLVVTSGSMVRGKLMEQGAAR